MIYPSRTAVATLAYGAAGFAAAAAMLLRFPPDAYSFYPRCPIFTLLHMQCPGCGATQALAALLHGHLHEALRLNALTTLLLPAVLLYCLLSLWNKPVEPRKHATSRKHATYGAVAFAGMFLASVFMIARNLP